MATTAGSQILLWDMATGQRRGQPLDGFTPQCLCAVLFSPDGRRAAIPSGTTVTVVDLASRKRVGLPITGQPVSYLDDGRIAVSVGETIELWRPDATEPVPFATPLDGAHTPGLAHWLSPSTVYGLPGKYGQSDAFALAGPASEWDASTGAPVDGLLGPQPTPPSGMSGGDSIVNRDGTLAAVGEADGIELWDIGHRRTAALLPTGQRQPIASWDPVAPILATTGLGGTLALWNVSDLSHITLLARSAFAGYAATSEPVAHFSPDGNTIAIAGFLNPISLVSVPGAVVRQVLTPKQYNFGAVFTSNSKTVAIIQGNYTGNAQVLVWDVATGRPRSTLPLPYPSLGSVAFVNSDRWLVTAETVQSNPRDQAMTRVDLWDVATSEPVGEPIMVSGDADPVEVDRPGGSRLLSGTSTPAGTYMVWDLDPTHWASTACGIAGRNLTQSEWKQYLPGRTYQLTCPEWPAGP